MILLKTIVLWKMNGDNFSDLLMFYQCGTVFQTVFLTACYNPETSSRVTLASLGTVFQTALSVLARLRLSRHVQNQSRITPMRRICSFTDFYVCCWILSPAGRNDCHGLSLAGGNPAPYGRKCNPCSFRH